MFTTICTLVGEIVIVNKIVDFTYPVTKRTLKKVGNKINQMIAENKEKKYRAQMEFETLR